MKIWIKVLLGLAVAGFVAGFLFVHFVINKPQPDFEKLKPAFTLDANMLYNNFKTSKETASRLYNGKVIEIKGKLSRVENVDTLTIAVFSFNKGMFGDEGIRCSMTKKYSAEAKKLKPDGVTRIKGFCTGYNETDVVMEHCSLIY